VADAVTPPSASAAEAARQRQARLTKPAGALGRLEDASIWLAAVQGSCPPHPFAHPTLVIFAGDHGIARTAGTSAYPPEVTAQMVANFASGGAAATVLARRLGVTVHVVDVSVDCPPDYVDALDPRIAARRVRRGSGSIDREDAMTPTECREAIALGRSLADEAIDEGADVLLPGDMGIGNTTPAAALIGVLTASSAEQVTGRGTGVDDATLLRKRAAVTAAMARVEGAHPDPAELLARIGSPDIAAMTAYLARASERGVPVILDGVVSGAAALVAEAMTSGARGWWIAGHRSTEPAARRALEHLALEPLVDLSMRLGEGTGALLALPHLDAAAITLAEMATFDSAGVSERESVEAAMDAHA
jgi:nicotinate-nucleotide--dimethylbenzimidazole phosphoribosyltransferase